MKSSGKGSVSRMRLLPLAMLEVEADVRAEDVDEHREERMLVLSHCRFVSSLRVVGNEHRASGGRGTLSLSLERERERIVEYLHHT